MPRIPQQWVMLRASRTATLLFMRFLLYPMCTQDPCEMRHIGAIPEGYATVNLTSTVSMMGMSSHSIGRHSGETRGFMLLVIRPQAYLTWISDPTAVNSSWVHLGEVSNP